VENAKEIAKSWLVVLPGDASQARYTPLSYSSVTSRGYIETAELIELGFWHKTPTPRAQYSSLSFWIGFSFRGGFVPL